MGTGDRHRAWQKSNMYLYLLIDLQSAQVSMIAAGGSAVFPTFRISL